MTQGRKSGIKNNKLYCKYNVKYFDMNTTNWNNYNCSTYEHIQDILKEHHNVNYSYSVIQNISLQRKKDKFLSITKCININPPPIIK